MMNHPVHIVTNDNQMSPSAFIPFCELGGNMSLMGVQVNHFEFPVCKGFQAKILNNQLCYEVDLDRYTVEKNLKNNLDLGFNFIMDYNEDRQVTFYKNFSEKQGIGLANSIVKSNQDKHAFIYLNTIGR